MKRIIGLVFPLLCLPFFCTPLWATPNGPESHRQGKAADFAFVLDIFGNADMNWTIDTRDRDYVRAVIEGSAAPTKYADADGNGVIDADDLAQIQRLLDGNPESITLIDSSGTQMTIDMPVKRVVSMAPWATRTLIQLRAQDTLVGIDAYTVKGSRYSGQLAFLQACPGLGTLTSIGTAAEPNKEVLASLDADMILAGRVKPDRAKILKQISRCPVVFQPTINMNGADYAVDNGPYENWLTMGYVFGKVERARSIIDFCEQEFAAIGAGTGMLAEKEKRSAWLCSGKLNRGSSAYSPILMAGAVMPFAGEKPFFGEIQLEQVLKWNPDVIFVQYWPHLSGMIDEMRRDKTLGLLKAVKNNDVFFIRDGRIGYDAAFCAAETWYIAKAVYPEFFQDVSVEDRANRMLEFLYGAPGLYTWEITARPVYKTW